MYPFVCVSLIRVSYYDQPVLLSMHFLKARFNLPEEVVGFKRPKKTDNGTLGSELEISPPDWLTDLTGSGTVGTVSGSRTVVAAVGAVDVAVEAVDVAVGARSTVFNLFEAKMLLGAVPKGFLKI